jgi:hypothetical protein
MNTKQYWIVAGIVVVLVGAGIWASQTRVAQAPTPEGPICAADVQFCSDGSYVSRTGPNCEFAPCPLATTTGSTSTPKPTTGIAIGDSQKINDTTITVLNLVSDSRCPTDVQCVWAGTVSVRVAIDALSRDFTFTLGEPQTVGNATITLTEVKPGQKNSNQTIASKDYRFTFTVVPKSATIPPPGDVACTMDAKQCPDGSYVGRTGPKCEFAPCPSSSI